MSRRRPPSTKRARRARRSAEAPAAQRQCASVVAVRRRVRSQSLEFTCVQLCQKRHKRCLASRLAPTASVHLRSPKASSSCARLAMARAARHEAQATRTATRPPTRSRRRATRARQRQIPSTRHACAPSLHAARRRASRHRRRSEARAANAWERRRRRTRASKCRKTTARRRYAIQARSASSTLPRAALPRASRAATCASRRRDHNRSAPRSRSSATWPETSRSQRNISRKHVQERHAIKSLRGAAIFEYRCAHLICCSSSAAHLQQSKTVVCDQQDPDFQSRAHCFTVLVRRGPIFRRRLRTVTAAAHSCNGPEARNDLTSAAAC
mmetsp:Transcript_148931/g.478528  ORF Transcript_148931/g.478528 Transcript_148931/m.478528 type:complete len:326 (+) Transcript_148931:875-1852(+)